MDTILGVAILGAGLNELWSSVLNDWIGPVFVGAVAVFAIYFIKDRKWTQLISFIGIAAVVGLLVFAGKDLFGSQDAKLTKVAKGAADNVNVVVVEPDLSLPFGLTNQ